MPRIVITQPVGLTQTQLEDLKALGDVTSYETISHSTDEWLSRVKNADVVYTNIHGFEEAWSSLQDVFVTLPFVGVGFLNKETLAANNVTVSRSPGCNQVAVSEWVVAMMLNYSRRFPEFVKVESFDVPTPFYTTSLSGKVVCIIGKGHIGTRVGEVLEALQMQVVYYTRNDDIAQAVREADYIVDCLSLNPSTENFYNSEFFDKTKDGVVFVTVSSNKTKDIEAITRLLEVGKIQCLITDNAQSLLFDTTEDSYKTLLNIPKVVITPHVAAYSDNTRETAAKICIENIRAFLAGNPINLV